MSELFDFGQKILAKQNFSALLGAELTKFEPGEAELTLVIRVLTDVVTSEYKINYVRPAIGEKLIARASVLASGKRQAVCQSKIFVIDGNKEQLVAVAQGTLNKVD